MDPALVAASEATTDGAVFHFALDPQVARTDYAPRKAAVRSATTGKVGRVGPRDEPHSRPRARSRPERTPGRPRPRCWPWRARPTTTAPTVPMRLDGWAGRQD
jgi:hypothetical protein